MPKEHLKYSNETAPDYFITVFKWSYIMLILYFICYMGLTLAFGLTDEWKQVIPWLVFTCITRYFMDRINIRWFLLVYTLVILGWMTFFIHTYGWNCGGINFIMPLMVISCFSLYDSLANKLIFACSLFLIRVGLFIYCQIHTPEFALNAEQCFILQTLNTAIIFFNMVLICIVFSANIQKAEKQLMVYNRELQLQANTDPLTGLSNRRSMHTLLENQIRLYPRDPFSIALGDIDFFKKVNDTYGHNCGDQVLKELAALFEEKARNKGYVCRWGGEEFLFFLPSMNLDDAGAFINDINLAVSALPIKYGEETHFVTMTFGVEEFDFRSDVAALVKRADDKLYYGKKHGRNRIIL